VKATVFLGGGRITAALIAGLRLAKYKTRILVHDHHPAKLRELANRYKVAAEPSLPRAVAQAQLLIVAVPPNAVSKLLYKIGGVRRPMLAVSLAAGVPLSTLRTQMGGPVRWARAMPSPVCRSGRGLTALTFAKGLPVGDRRALRLFFSNLGSVVELSELHFDAFTATYSPSHGYHALHTLAGAAIKLGLPPKLALTAAAHALGDSIVSWRGARIPLRTLIREAATPGGIAASVMSSLDRGNYGALVEKALRAGLARARANRKMSALPPGRQPS